VQRAQHFRIHEAKGKRNEREKLEHKETLPDARRVLDTDTGRVEVVVAAVTQARAALLDGIEAPAQQVPQRLERHEQRAHQVLAEDLCVVYAGRDVLAEDVEQKYDEQQHCDNDDDGDVGPDRVLQPRLLPLQVERRRMRTLLLRLGIGVNNCRLCSCPLGWYGLL